jgi:hemolysin III
LQSQALCSGDEIRPRLRGRLHAIATALAVAALAWLVRSAASVEATVAAWVYGVSSVLCYLTSSLYHIVARTERARALLRRADHSMIYVFIAGSFTPVCLLAMSGWWRWPLIGLVWLGALVGVGLSVPARPRLPHFGVALYQILGWAGVAALPALAHHPVRVVLVGSAGLLYTAGAILFGLRRPVLHPGWFGYHEFWHGIGIVAGALIFVVNLSLIAAPTGS